MSFISSNSKLMAVSIASCIWTTVSIADEESPWPWYDDERVPGDELPGGHPVEHPARIGWTAALGSRYRRGLWRRVTREVGSRRAELEEGGEDAKNGARGGRRPITCGMRASSHEREGCDGGAKARASHLRRVRGKSESEEAQGRASTREPSRRRRQPRSGS